MASSNPPVNGAAFIVYLPLQDFANPGSYKANPTIATGDFQVSIDGGAFANLATLPTVTPAAGRSVKISLSAGEMTGDNIFIQCVDQTATKEWADYAFTVQTVAAAPYAGGAVASVTGNVGGNVVGTVGSVVGAVGSVTGAVGSVTGNVGGNVTGSVGSVVGAVGSVTGNVGGNVNGNVVGSVASVTADVGITQGGADKVWLSAARTLTSFGTLVADVTTAVWAAGSRTLTGIASGILAAGELNNIADAIFKRDWTAITGEAARSLLNAGRKLMNRVGFVAPTLTVYKEDDATPAYTQTVTQDAAQTPFKALDTN